MKAWLWERYGGADSLGLAEVPQPVPGPNEALVRVLGASVNAADWHSMRGQAPLLAEIGKKLGYSIWIGRREQRETAAGIAHGDAVRLRDLSHFKDLTVLTDVGPTARRRVEQIDCLWIKRSTIAAIFEVENTTGITEALIRASNVPYGCPRFLVLREERAALLTRKLDEPGFRELHDVESWRAIYYTPLSDYWERSRRRKVTLDNFMDEVVAQSLGADSAAAPTLF